MASNVAVPRQFEPKGFWIVRKCIEKHDVVHGPFSYAESMQQLVLRQSD
jgi:hypothetical protein